MRALLLGVLCGGLLFAGLPASAAAAPAGACTVKQAQRDAHAAQRAYVRAAGRYREARRVLAATRKYAGAYGSGVARWVRLARREGFRWDQLPVVLAIIDRESGGDPLAKNPASTASGLWQFLAFWWEGKWDPFSAPASMHYAHKAVDEVGWSPWSL